MEEQELKAEKESRGDREVEMEAERYKDREVVMEAVKQKGGALRSWRLTGRS